MLALRRATNQMSMTLLDLHGLDWTARIDSLGRLNSLRIGAPGVSNLELLSVPGSFCRLASAGEPLPLQSVEALPGETQGCRLVYPGAEVQVRAGESALLWEIQSDIPNLLACFPVLGDLFSADEHWPPLLDACSRSLFRSADWLLPLCRRITPQTSLTFLSYAPFPTPPEYPNGLWAEPGITLADGKFSAELRFHPGAWREAFGYFRQGVRSRFNLAEYYRGDTAWYQNQWVQHFTFLYGAEILNLHTGRLELDRLLDMGAREFGGFDAFLAWGGYPRLGIDPRTQWDFYDDLPGGRAGLRELGRQARARGARFFLPYLPWDRKPGDETNPEASHTHELARLIAETEADGVFLDTLSGIGSEFRQAVDRLRPGVVFCSEGRARPESLELVTGSWSETALVDIRQGNWSAAPEKMPDLILLRYLFPEHRIFIGARHAGGEDRLTMLARGLFNGVGWMVWQDIFGLPLPYTPEAARRLRAYSRICRENQSVLLGAAPTPLVETLHPSVYANEFAGPEKRLWMVYNESDSPISGPILPIQLRPDRHWIELFSNSVVEVQDGALYLDLLPHGLVVIVELPSHLEWIEKKLRLTNGLATEASLELVRGEATEAFTISAAEMIGSILDLTGRVARFGQPRHLRLLAGGELLDQIPYLLERS